MANDTEDIANIAADLERAEFLRQQVVESLRAHTEVDADIDRMLFQLIEATGWNLGRLVGLVERLTARVLQLELEANAAELAKGSRL